MKNINMPRNLAIMIGVPLFAYLFGWQLDRFEDERLSRFRDKSALYRRDVLPDKPSW